MRNISTGLFFLVVAGIISAPRAMAQLKVLEGDSISFGTIYETGKQVHETFTLENAGQKEVIIKNIHTSCGCTVASAADTALAPGKNAKVQIDFNPTGYAGAVTKYIYIISSEQDTDTQKMIQVTMTGNVAFELQPIPNSVFFYNTATGYMDSTAVFLNNISHKTMRITGIKLPFNYLHYKLDKRTLRPGQSAHLEVYLAPDKEGIIDGELEIFTTSKNQPVLPLRVFAGIIGK